MREKAAASRRTKITRTDDRLKPADARTSHERALPPPYSPSGSSDSRPRRSRLRGVVILAIIAAAGVVGFYLGWPLKPATGKPASTIAPINGRLVRSRADLTRSDLESDSVRQVLRDPSARFPVTIAPQSTLRLALAASKKSWKGGLDEIEFTVAFRSPNDRPLTLWRQKLTSAEDEQWHDATIPLDALAGRSGSIELGTTAVRGRLPPPSDVYWTPPTIESPGPASGLNIILISIDTLRADHLGCYGAGRDTSPNLDRLARDGVRFRQAIAPSSWTLPSHASMLTGLNPSHHEAVGYSLNTHLSDQYPTLAELLWDSGYDTVAFTEGGFVSPYLGFARGFERYDAPMLNTDGLSQNLEEAHRWLQQPHRRPFFLFFHTYAVHMPYAPPPPYDTMFDPDYRGPFQKAFMPLDYKPYAQLDNLDAPTVRHLEALYDGEIRHLDTRLGKLFDLLTSSELASRTCVIVTSDHGEEFKEHGNLFHHRAKLYEELIRVPLIVWCPGRPGGGRVIEQPASLVDIAPTVLDLVGAPTHEGFDGISLGPSVRGEGHPPDRITVSEVDGSVEHRQGHVVALRTPEHKFLSETWTAAPRLFDLRRDPHETQDVSGDQPDIVERFAGLLDSPLLARRPSAAEAANKPSAKQAPTDAATLEHLRALGYTD